MRRKYKATYDESTDTYTISSLNNSKKTGIRDVITDIAPSNLKTLEEAMGIKIVAYDRINSSKDETKENSINGNKNHKVNNDKNHVIFGANNI